MPKLKILSVGYSGLTLSTIDRGADTLFEIELPVLRTMRIQVDILGNENLYFFFVDDQAITRRGFCKCL